MQKSVHVRAGLHLLLEVNCTQSSASSTVLLKRDLALCPHMLA